MKASTTEKCEDGESLDSRRQDRGGVIMPMVLVVLLVVSFLGSGLIALSTYNNIETSDTLSKLQAFWTAEAGLHEALTIAHINRYQNHSDEAFPPGQSRQWNGSTAVGTYEVVVDSQLTYPPSFVVTSEGVSTGGKVAAVQLGVYQKQVVSLGLFGNSGLQIKSGAGIYSYDSSVTDDPTPADSTGNAVIGSNLSIDIQATPKFALDGSIQVGQDPETEISADLDISGPGADNYGAGGFPTGHIDPDPLDLLGDPTVPGTLAFEFANAASGDNDNNTVSAIIGDALRVQKDTTATISAGRYYLTSLTVDNNGELRADVSDGPVIIYLSGSMSMTTGSTMTLLGGAASDFRIYANSSAPDTIDCSPKSDLACFVYAPDMLVHMQPNGNLVGGVWGGTVEIWPGGNIFIDEALQNYDTFDAYLLQTSAWRKLPR